ncbi:MAG: hypothetical protein F4039_05020 [Gammaproteobacteria bacterium]|nr:hypothetical protein [Gammaproteobacteria bacterium]
MNSEVTIKKNIENVLKNFDDQPLREAATNLLNTLGYYSKRVGNDDIDHERFNRLLESALDTANPSDKLRIDDWQSFYQIMQVADEEINQQIDPEQGSLFESTQIDDTLRTSYMFVTVQLTKNTYTRTQLADITRFINKAFEKSIMVIFRYGAVLSLAIINRRPNLRNTTKQVLEKVTLIKDINLDSPKRAHIDIISELHLRHLIENEGVRNFDTLHDAWENILNTEALNKQFYRKLFAWYEWAVKEATFPTDENRVIKPEEHVIRLITRLLFIWFIKEKGLVADALFNKSQIQDLLNEDDFNNGDSYYRAVLQNLFFATLNTEIDKRKFSKESYNTNRDFSCYRYKKQMDDPNKLLSLFAQTPFINGGLFDCLDTFKATGKESYRIDCFSDNQYHKLSIPNRLLFDENRGLLPLLEHYKFTVEENTPVDQEVALDPELLGRVFENLLAAINPETGETARKQTGSYYTPRAIVDYMVEETLIATLSEKCQPTDGNEIPWDERLRYLFDYAQMFDDASEWFDDRETDAIVKTISDLKILDPAVGSGAFPMGILHKLTLALRRLDPDNTRWEALQKQLAGERAAAAFNTQDQQERDDELTEISETFERYRDSDFGRKLYLIQNSIFGVDIQPIACQIAKLRFFISLAIEQEPDRDADNFGIKPLPNLETRFVAADTLIGIDLSETSGLFQDDTVQQLLKEIDSIRERFFLANNRTQKRKLEEQEEKCRKQLEKELERQRTEWIENRQREIDQKVNQLPTAELREQLREKEQKTFETRQQEFDAEFENARKIVRWKPYDQNAKTDWFEPERMFGIRDGVDLVLGNPPYVQLQKESGRLGKLYQDKGFETFARTGDIYCLFYEKANQLLKNNGHVCFITSNKWMRAGYGKKLRDHFVTFTQPVQLLDMGPDVFDATVDTNILLFQTIGIADPVDFRAVSIGTDFDKQTGSIAQYLSDNGAAMKMPAKGEPWTILSSAELNLKRKIEDVGEQLKDWDININFGIKIGCNEAFIIDEAKREQLIAQDPKSTEIIKPLLRGKDLKRYHAQQGKFYILATGYDLDIPNKYPAIYNHLETIGEQIELGEIKARGKGLFNRDDQGENWWNLRACAYYSEFDKEKMVWGNIAYHSTFCYAAPGEFIAAPANLLTSESNDIKYLLACMNSKIFNWEFTKLGIPLGYAFEWKKQYVELIHVPRITDRNHEIVEKIKSIVEQLLTAKRTDPNTDTSNLENEIDKLVYELYNLTEDEIAIVEGSV